MFKFQQCCSSSHFFYDRAVRGLLESCTDADGFFTRWRRCSDTITSNHELYVYWKEVCLLIERQCLYIEKKSPLFSFLNSAPKEICFAVSPIVIQEVEDYLKEVDAYENEAKHCQVEEGVRAFINDTFHHPREKMEATLTMVKSVLNRSELNEVVDETRRRREETNEVVEESTLEVADRILGPLIYGTSPSVNIPFLPPTSSRRRAIGSGGGVFPDLAFQHKLEGDYQVFVSSAVNPVAFTIQLVSEESQLMCIQGDLNKMVLKPVAVKKGMEYAAKYHDDDTWYRAKVTEVTGKGVEVEFFDYGNIQLCKEQDPRELPHMLRDQPLAYRCCLTKLEDLNAFYGSLRKGELSDDSDFQYGQPCVLLDDKGNFHRAVYTSDLNANGDFEVCLIDKGIAKKAKKQFAESYKYTEELRQLFRELVPHYYKPCEAADWHKGIAIFPQMLKAHNPPIPFHTLK
ncbi:hypothetical protein DAPPUDRAFT_322199 [Daphnia pulex]|uniref:Tudor domain-containing protein n=1 Tax=Daphnia pulex TaxID=6669 RepID=E9GV82_DAPPU|nr:hypothetical protein DAPPUDRAFT_322199 [Daphnia pulex]|eukprot:EFX76657.1 hypothetical protein DAPPUDRAFT_322199 [Daphnia pulex]